MSRLRVVQPPFRVLQKSTKHMAHRISLLQQAFDARCTSRRGVFN